MKVLYKITLLFRQGHVTVLEVSECLLSCPHCLWFEFSFLLLFRVMLPVWDLHCSLMYESIIQKKRSEDLPVDSLETGHSPLSLVLYLLPRQVNSDFPAFLAAAKVLSKFTAAAVLLCAFALAISCLLELAAADLSPVCCGFG